MNKFRFFGGYLSLLVIALLSVCTLQAWAAARVQLTPIRQSMAQPRSLKPSSGAPKAQRTGANNFGCSFMVALCGCDARISALTDSEGNKVYDEDGLEKARVEIYNPETKSWEDYTDMTIDFNGIEVPVIWSSACFFAGGQNGDDRAVYDSDGEDIGTYREPVRIGTCNITMTGGTIGAIMAAGYDELGVVPGEDGDAIGAVAGDVNINITGGNIASVHACGLYETNTIQGNVTIHMSNCQYLSFMPPVLDKQYATNVTAYIENVTFADEEAVPDCDPASDIYCNATGILSQDATGKQYFIAGNLTLSDKDYYFQSLTVQPGAVVTNNTRVIFDCDGNFENKGTWNGNAIEKSSHIERYVFTKAPTCTSSGTARAVCMRCRKIVSRTITIPALGHDSEVVDAYAATCTEAGHTSYTKCKRCGINVTKPIVIPAKGHNYKEVKGTYGCNNTTATAKVCQVCKHTELDYGTTGDAHDFTRSVGGIHIRATCTSCEIVELVCKKCKLSFPMANGTPLGHNAVLQAAVEPTCTENGSPEHYYCDRCNKHSMHADMSDRSSNAPAIEPLGHDFSKETVVAEAKKTDATCTTGALYYYSCSRCDEIECNHSDDVDALSTFEHKDLLTALGHAYAIESIVPNEDQPESGVVNLNCKKCGDKTRITFGRETVLARTKFNFTRNVARAEFLKPVKEATCVPGEAVYRLTVSVGALNIMQNYNAVLAPIPNKHDWDDNGDCRNCGAHTAAALVTDYTEENEVDKSLVYEGQQVIAYSSAARALAAKKDWAGLNTLDTKTLHIFDNAALDDLNLTGSNATNLVVDLHQHTMNAAARTLVSSNAGNTLTLKDGEMKANLSDNGVANALVLDGATLTVGQAEWKGTIQKINGAKLNYGLVDGTTYTQTADVEADEVAYVRPFAGANVNKFTSLYVPFSFEVTQDMIDTKCDIMEIYNISVPYDTNGNGDLDDGDEKYLVVHRLKAGEIAEANTPYLIRPKVADANFRITAQDAIVAKAEATSVDCTTTRERYVFTGNYEPIMGMATDKRYFMGDGKLRYTTSDDTVLNPNRWSLQILNRKTGAVITETKALNFLDIDGWNDTETGIIMVDDKEAEHLSTYTLDGRKVNTRNMRSGLYIQNGKKVVVK